MRTHSFALFGADLVVLMLSSVAAVITARALMPAGKGYYSSLMLLVGLAMNAFSAGLGEAAIVMTGRREFPFQAAAEGTMAAQLPLSVAGALCCFGLGWLALGLPQDGGVNALVAAAVVVALMSTYNTVVSFLMAEERLTAYAALSVTLGVLTTAMIWLLLVPLRQGVAGAVVGSVLGSSVVLLVAVLLVGRAGTSLRPRRVRGYLRKALRIGGAVQVSNVLILLTARVDLLLVYRIADPATAGRYSVALTIGALVGTVPIAVSHASFPRLARLGEEEANNLAAYVFRAGVLTAGVAALVLSLLTPAVVPTIFGPLYQQAVVPSVILLVAGIFWSGQWLLTRAAVARGASRPLVFSFASSFVLMVLLDFVLIPPLAATGAAIAASVSSAVGFVVATLAWRDQGFGCRNLMPRATDVADLMALIRHPRKTRPPGQ